MQLANNGVLYGVVLASSWEQFAVIILRPCRGASSRPAPEQLRHRTAEEQETDRVKQIKCHSDSNFAGMSAEQEWHEFLQDLLRETSLEIHVNNTGGCQFLEC